MLDWFAMLVVVANLYFLYTEHMKTGALLGMLGATLWAFVALETGNVPLFLLQAVIFGLSVYGFCRAIWPEKEEKSIEWNPPYNISRKLACIEEEDGWCKTAMHCRASNRCFRGNIL